MGLERPRYDLGVLWFCFCVCIIVVLSPVANNFSSFYAINYLHYNHNPIELSSHINLYIKYITTISQSVYTLNGFKLLKKVRAQKG